MAEPGADFEGHLSVYRVVRGSDRAILRFGQWLLYKLHRPALLGAGFDGRSGTSIVKTMCS